MQINKLARKNNYYYWKMIKQTHRAKYWQTKIQEYWVIATLTHYVIQ